ncbi:MAG: hypothetical protein ACOX8T_12940 [Bacillota bacterium]|jgi:hypothetical protein
MNDLSKNGDPLEKLNEFIPREEFRLRLSVIRKDSNSLGGRFIEASIVSVPKQRNGRDENNTIKEGDSPEDWSENKRRKSKDIYADSAYSSKEREKWLKERCFRPHLQLTAQRLSQ